MSEIDALQLLGLRVVHEGLAAMRAEGREGHELARGDVNHDDALGTPWVIELGRAAHPREGRDLLHVDDNSIFFYFQPLRWDARSLVLLDAARQHAHAQPGRGDPHRSQRHGPIEKTSTRQVLVHCYTWDSGLGEGADNLPERHTSGNSTSPRIEEQPLKNKKRFRQPRSLAGGR